MYQSPVDDEDYEGLQVDTRPKPTKASPAGLWNDDDVDFTAEKEAKGGVEYVRRHSELSPNDSYGTWTAAYGSSTLSPTTPDVAKAMDIKTINSRSAHTSMQTAKPEIDNKPRSRKRFWVIFGVLILIIIILAALAGGLAGGLYRKNKNAPKPEDAAKATLPSVFPAAQRADVMIDSPLCIVSYDLGGTDKAPKRQEFRIYFQSLFGNIKESVSTGSQSWQNARPILTDALNNTGLATFTYLNGTQQQGSIFYVGNNGLLQEKRKIYSDNQYWQVGKLNSLNIPMTGNLTSPVNNNDPKNTWDGYRFAAVYSRNFSTGPGARLFYHAQEMDGSNFVQELIWAQNNDSWTKGAMIEDANPNSHLAATVDESIGILRLFFSSGNRSLLEAWTSMGSSGGNYTKGRSCAYCQIPPWLTFYTAGPVDSFLSANNADLAAVSSNGTTYLYHYASPAQTASVGIRELVIRRTSQSRQESFNLSEPIVTSPLLPGGTNASLYQPLAASITAVRDLPPQFLVFWADKPTGDPNTNSTGYQSLAQVSRPANSNLWPSGMQLSVPLGNEVRRTSPDSFLFGCD